MVQLFWRVTFYSRVVKTCPGHSFPLVHINVCDPFFFFFFTCQHLAWLGVSCQHLFIYTSGDFNQRWVGNCTGGVCMIQWREFGAVPYSPPCFGADGQWQRRLHLCPLWEWKMGIEYAVVCKGYRTCHCMPLIHFPSNSHTQIPANHLSVRVQGCHELWALVIQPPSQACFQWITGVSSRPARL